MTGLGPRRRGIALLLLAAGLTLTYLGVLFTFDLTETPYERLFGEGAANPARLRLYLDPLSMDTSDDSMQVKIYVTPGPALRGRGANTLNRDITVDLVNNDSVEQRVFHANEPIVPVTIQVDLTDGDVAHYPLDRYRVDLRFIAHEGLPDSLGAAVAQEVTVWEHMLGYHVASRESAQGGPGDISLRLDVRRAGAQVFFALAAYFSMVVVACTALVISSLVFLGRRTVETTLVGALAALVFALPALRNALPGGPPLGVQADVAVFLWAELAAVIALALFVLTWARQRR